MAANVMALVWIDARLTHAARLVLMRMAWSAHDGDEQPVYFAGWEPLAAVLGYGLEPDPDSAAQRAVTRALADLTDLQLIATDSQWPRHHKRRYQLHIPGPRTVTRPGEPARGSRHTPEASTSELLDSTKGAETTRKEQPPWST